MLNTEKKNNTVSPKSILHTTNISKWDKKNLLLQIKPLRENDRGIENWIGFIRNLGSIKSSINFLITGNNTKKNNSIL
jgi:hypothetical protein